MTDQTYPPSQDFVNGAHVDAKGYAEMYVTSINEPEAFWREHGKRVDWIKPFTKVKNVSYAHPDISIKWFEDGTLNVAANCVDRHLATRRDQIAILWEGDNPSDSKAISYGQLYTQVCKLANIYKSLGVRKGDRVVLYMPMIPEAAYAMLACARIGAIHSIVFGGFSPEARPFLFKQIQEAIVIFLDA